MELKNDINKEMHRVYFFQMIGVFDNEIFIYDYYKEEKNFIEENNKWFKNEVCDNDRGVFKYLKDN